MGPAALDGVLEGMLMVPAAAAPPVAAARAINGNVTMLADSQGGMKARGMV